MNKLTKYIVPNLIILLFSILLIGCKPQQDIITCQNITINNTKIEYVYNTTEIEVFIDRPCNCTNETVFISSSNNTCDISLINQIKILERTIDRWAMIDINITDEINITNSTNNET